jgi:hypothetical protein
VYQGTCAGASAGKCSQCTAGSIKVGSDWSAKCTACKIGHFETQTRQLCKACTPGRFAGSAGSTRCKSCATGLFADASKSSECKTCGCATCTRYAHTTGADLPSHVVSAGHTDCSAHTVCDAVLEYETGAAGPITNRKCAVARICAAGEYESSPLKATANRECQPCPIGSKCAGAAAPIVPCTGTTYQDLAGQDHCKTWYACNQHQYETRTPSASRDRICASHKHCSATEYETVEGSYSSDRSCATLTRCSPGYKETLKPVHVFRRGSLLNRKCGQCDSGKFMPDTNHAKDACVMCPLGRAEDSKGSALCETCLPGTAQDTLGQTTCKACDEHEWQDTRGQATCKKCDYECARGLIHKGCGVDKAGSCQQCAAGHFKETKSATRSCDECPTGHVQPNKGEWMCNACEGGQFQDTKAQLTCKTCDYTCPTGEQHLGCGGSENGGCQQCTPGRHKEGANEKNDLQLCTDCAPGTFHPEHGASTCKSCISGRYQPSSKQTSCRDCLKIAATCKIGEYHSGCGSDKPGTCPECDAGTFKANAGAGSCSDCAAGRFQDTPGKGDCKDCVGPLFFQPLTGQKTCRTCNYKCPIGKEHTACGSANGGHCYKCQAGRAKNNAVGEKPGGADRCEACKPGNYQDKTGQGTCKACDGFNEWQPDAHATFCLKTRVCSKTEYETVAPTKSTNRVCASHATCNWSSQYETRPAGTHFDRICAPLTIGNPEKQWESRAAGKTFDRQFKTATLCKKGEFEVAALTKTSDRVCKKHRICHTTKEWETKAASAYTDRECATHTQCTSTEWETKSKGTKHDRECSMLQVCPNLTCKEDTGMMFVQHHHTDHEVGFKYHRCGITNKIQKKCVCMCDSYKIQKGAMPKPNPPKITFPEIGETGNSKTWEASRTWERHNHNQAPNGYFGAVAHATDHAHHNKLDSNGKAHKIDPWLDVTKSKLQKCGVGYYCHDNERKRIPPGYRATGGEEDTRSGIVKCGDAAHWCFGGVQHKVSPGHYTVGGTQDTRNAQRVCGENKYWCSKGIRKVVKCGYFSAGQDSTTRTSVIACGAPTHFCSGGIKRKVSAGFFSINSCSQTKCGSDEYFCVNGARHPVPDFAMATGGDHTGATHTGCTRYNCHPGNEFVSSSCLKGGCVPNNKP